jgi:hypothetical protein
MCAIPSGGFDPESEFFARKVKPDIQMFMLEYAACGGVPNWQENPAAVDPMESDEKTVGKKIGLQPDDDPISPPDGKDKKSVKSPVTAKDIAEVGIKK